MLAWELGFIWVFVSICPLDSLRPYPFLSILTADACGFVKLLFPHLFSTTPSGLYPLIGFRIPFSSTPFLLLYSFYVRSHQTGLPSHHTLREERAGQGDMV